MSGKFWGNIGLGAVLISLVAFGVTQISASPGVMGLLLPEVKVSAGTAELLHYVKLIPIKKKKSRRSGKIGRC